MNNEKSFLNFRQIFQFCENYVCAFKDFSRNKFKDFSRGRKYLASTWWEAAFFHVIVFSFFSRVSC